MGGEGGPGGPCGPLRAQVPYCRFCPSLCHKVLQEADIPQLRPTPIFCDSQATVFAANDAAAAKKSIWVSRRVAVLRDAVTDGSVSFHKINLK